MRIAGTEINLAFKALEVYVSGCGWPHCKGCHNAELWDFGVGDLWQDSAKRLKEKAVELRQAGLADYAWILGGEPLDQDLDSLEDLIWVLKDAGLCIVLWTHYEKVPKRMLDVVDYVKTGPYIEGQEGYVEPVFGVKLANIEQKIWNAKELAC